MSAYVTRYCHEHGEWDMDVDNPGECPTCEAEGKLDWQKKDGEIASLRAALKAKEEENERLRQEIDELTDWRDENTALRKDLAEQLPMRDADAFLIGNLNATIERQRERIEAQASSIEGFERREKEYDALVDDLRAERKALREYIEFLGKEVVDAWAFLHVHGMKCPQETIDRGVALRARIGRREDGTWEER